MFGGENERLFNSIKRRACGFAPILIAYIDYRINKKTEKDI